MNLPIPNQASAGSQGIQRANPGDPLTISAKDWNEIASVVDKARQGDLASVIDGAELQDGLVQIKNVSGGDYLLYSIVRINGALITPADNELDFNDGPLFEARTPDASGEVIGILTEPIEDTKFGTARVLGFLSVKVNITDVTHDFVDRISGDATKLVSAASGGVGKILYKPAGTGDKDCAVLLTNGGGGGGASFDPNAIVLTDGSQSDFVVNGFPVDFTFLNDAKAFQSLGQWNEIPNIWLIPSDSPDAQTFHPLSTQIAADMADRDGLTGGFAAMDGNSTGDAFFFYADEPNIATVNLPFYMSTTHGSGNPWINFISGDELGLSLGNWVETAEADWTTSLTPFTFFFHIQDGLRLAVANPNTNAITGGNIGAKEVIVAGDQTTKYPADEQVIIAASTDIDGSYVVASSAYAGGPNETTVTMVGAFPGVVLDGNLAVSNQLGFAQDCTTWLRKSGGTARWLSTPLAISNRDIRYDAASNTIPVKKWDIDAEMLFAEDNSMLLDPISVQKTGSFWKIPFGSMQSGLFSSWYDHEADEIVTYYKAQNGKLYTRAFALTGTAPTYTDSANATKTVDPNTVGPTFLLNPQPARAHWYLLQDYDSHPDFSWRVIIAVLYDFTGPDNVPVAVWKYHDLGNFGGPYTP